MMHGSVTSLCHGCLLLVLQAAMVTAHAPSEDACTVEVEASGRLKLPLSLLQIGKDKAQLSHSMSLKDMRDRLERTVLFEPEKWNEYIPLRKSHNCYEYALNDVDKTAVNRCKQLMNTHGENSKVYKKCRRYFHIPGYEWHQQRLRKAVRFNRTSVTCQHMLQRIALDGTGALLWAGKDGKPTKDVDNRGVQSWKHGDSCPTDHYMASVVVKPQHRFHFYRRDRPCSDPKNKGKLCWTHKPGILNATHLDASNKEIPNLHAANRVYGKHAYTDVCGFFCVPGNNVASTHSDFFRGQKGHVTYADV